MRIVSRPKHEILTPVDFLKYQLQLIEQGGRLCYQNDKGNTNPESALKFFKNLINNEHLSVTEHSSITVKFMDFSIAGGRELLRHRLTSPSQESTRYVKVEHFSFCFPPHRDVNSIVSVKYPGDGGKEKEFKGSLYEFLNLYEAVHSALYKQLDWDNEDARFFIPLGETADIIVTTNIREWRYIFKMRLTENVHWEVRYILSNFLEELKVIMPGVFDDFVKVGVCKKGIPFYVEKFSVGKLLRLITNFFRVATEEEIERLEKGFAKELSFAKEGPEI